jgi:hypothetical protein
VLYTMKKVCKIKIVCKNVCCPKDLTLRDHRRKMKWKRVWMKRTT